MNPFMVLMKKEYVQMARDYKLVWLPLIFILLGISQPLLTYYLPDILASVGGGEGIIIDPDMAPNTGGEVIAATLGSQFDQIGLMILVISLMGIIQADKESGMLGFILTRPVPAGAYVGGKLLSHFTVTALSVAIGYFLAYAYAVFLFSGVSLVTAVLALLLYLVWVLFIVSLTSMLSTMINGQPVIALAGIGILLLCSMTSGMHPVMAWLNPAGMSLHAVQLLAAGAPGDGVYVNMAVTLILSMAAVLIAQSWIAGKKFNQA